MCLIYWRPAPLSVTAMTRIPQRVIFLLPGRALIPAGPLGAAETAPAKLSESQDYTTCMRLVASDPNTALESAGIWIVRGGGYPARDCQALAIVALGSPGEGAQRLDALASEMAR